MLSPQNERESVAQTVQQSMPSLPSLVQYEHASLPSLVAHSQRIDTPPTTYHHLSAHHHYHHHLLPSNPPIQYYILVPLPLSPCLTLLLLRPSRLTYHRYRYRRPATAAASASRASLLIAPSLSPVFRQPAFHSLTGRRRQPQATAAAAAAAALRSALPTTHLPNTHALDTPPTSIPPAARFTPDTRRCIRHWLHHTPERASRGTTTPARRRYPTSPTPSTPVGHLAL
ncbi:hypothetical protein Q7P37_011034 [Cladosporium fusiforme]